VFPRNLSPSRNIRKKSPQSKNHHPTTQNGGGNKSSLKYSRAQQTRESMVPSPCHTARLLERGLSVVGDRELFFRQWSYSLLITPFCVSWTYVFG
jgi:hypothetical protein